MMRNFFYVVPAFLVLIYSDTGFSKTIYGFDSAQQFNKQSNDDFYIQAGSFISKPRAVQYQVFLQSKTSYPVKTVQYNDFYRVTIGPIHTAREVRRVAENMSSPIKTWPVAISSQAIPSSNQEKKYYLQQKRVNPVFTSVSSDLGLIKNRANWFVTVGGGAQFPDFNSSMAINNNSGFLPPYNLDVYSTSSNSEPIIGVTAGRRWERINRWFPSYSIGIMYQYFFPTNAGSTIMQYSLPAFTNYIYKWNLSSNLVLASAKINILQFANKISPFINGGIGGAFNRASGYGEVALPGVTPRLSPGFANNTTSQFTYAIGAGVDYKITPQLIAAVGYNFQDLGHFSSGSGIQTWSGQTLNLGTYQSNDVFVSISYLFEK